MAGNRRHGNVFNYRDHTVESRPPAHPEGTARGDLARRDDTLAAGLVKMYMSQGAPWALENSAGYLWRREYMECINSMRRQVSYCAYWSKAEEAGGRFQKHTHLWTNKASWEPIGSTGTGRCKAHGRHDSLQDTKSERLRCRVPEALVVEWMRAPLALMI